jgi:hypothetical protein
MSTVTEHACPSCTRFTHRTFELHYAQGSSVSTKENGEGLCYLQSVKPLILLLDNASRLACLQWIPSRWTMPVAERSSLQDNRLQAIRTILFTHELSNNRNSRTSIIGTFQIQNVHLRSGSLCQTASCLSSITRIFIRSGGVKPPLPVIATYKSPC